MDHASSARKGELGVTLDAKIIFFTERVWTNVPK